jgi:hypothetical protein
MKKHDELKNLYSAEPSFSLNDIYEEVIGGEIKRSKNPEPVEEVPKELSNAYDDFFFEPPDCSVCGGKLASIRGKRPNDKDRLVCPTCLAERMDRINSISGEAYE